MTRNEELAGLVSRAETGDKEAWTKIYEMIFRDIHFICMEILRDEIETQDAEQSTFIKLIENLNQLEKPESFLSWAKRIAATTSLNMLKKRKDYVFSAIEGWSADEDNESTVFEIEDTSIEFRPEEQADIRETSRIIKEMLDELPEEQRISLELLYGSELSVKEIAEAMNVSENTVKSRLRYGRNAMEEKVENLRKKGTKLYAIPIGILIRFLCRDRIEAYAADCSGAFAVKMAETMNRAGQDNSVSREGSYREPDGQGEIKDINETNTGTEVIGSNAEETAQEEEEGNRANPEDYECNQEKNCDGFSDESIKKAGVKKSGLSIGGKVLIGGVLIAVAVVGTCFLIKEKNNPKNPKIQERPTISEAIDDTAMTSSAAQVVVETMAAETLEVPPKAQISDNPPITGKSILVNTVEIINENTSKKEDIAETESIEETTEEQYQEQETQSRETNPQIETEEMQAQETEPEIQNREQWNYVFGYADDDDGASIYISDHELSDEEIAELEAEYGKPLTVINDQILF